MSAREEHRCSFARQTVVTTHAGGRQTRVSVELASFDGKLKGWSGLGGLGGLGGVSAHATPVLGRRSDALREGRQSAQCSPVARRRTPASPGGSPLPPRRADDAAPEDELDSVISGWLKFRDNKRWKSRWGVVTKLSPAADCLHLQLYREPRDRRRRGQCRASLSLQAFLGFESGFTLDRESNTLALVCGDVVVCLAFEGREQLISWQVKLSSQLGASSEYVVLVGAGSGRLPAGPARLHVAGRRLALTAGAPPRLLGLWELAQLRRYGVVDGRFCFEGGSLSGAGEGLHVLLTDRARDIAAGLRAAAAGTRPAPAAATAAARRSQGGFYNNRPDTRLSDFNTFDQSLPDTSSGLYEENFYNEDFSDGATWLSDERQSYGEGEQLSCEEIGAKPPWSGADHVTLERCSHCLTKLGCTAKLSTVPISEGGSFNPTWNMEDIPQARTSENSSYDTEYLTPRAIRKQLQLGGREPPGRPPKPFRLEQKKPPCPLPTTACACFEDNSSISTNAKVGPYENYDVPRAINSEVDAGEHYDTPKRIKQHISDDLFRVTKGSPQDSLVLKKTCGCILKFGSKKKTVIVECDENLQPVDCPCQKVTNWANNLISLPYCKRNSESQRLITDVVSEKNSDQMALYATVDISRKTNRQSGNMSENDVSLSVAPENTDFTNYENIEPQMEHPEIEGPYGNYENLEFAMSLEHYENAKDLLKQAGVTQNELDALTANINKTATTLTKKTKCVHCHSNQQDVRRNKSDEYLLMEPSESNRSKSQILTTNPGYTPMSPNPKWSHSLRHPMHKLENVSIEKSLSNPVINVQENQMSIYSNAPSDADAAAKRSHSVDSADLLDDMKEFDTSPASRATSSSLETLRNIAVSDGRSSSPCQNEQNCDQNCCKSSGSDNKTSETASPAGTPPLRSRTESGDGKRGASAAGKPAPNRDSSSSNDSGVSSCSMKLAGAEHHDYDRRQRQAAHPRLRGCLAGCAHSSLPRKSKSSDPLRDLSLHLHRVNIPAKSSSAEAEIPVLQPKQFKGVADTHSTSSGASDLSDYADLCGTSLSSSPSSAHEPMNVRSSRQTSTLRPRSGKEYHNLDPILTSMYKCGQDLAHYTNLP